MEYSIPAEATVNGVKYTVPQQTSIDEKCAEIVAMTVEACACRVAIFHGHLAAQRMVNGVSRGMGITNARRDDILRILEGVYFGPKDNSTQSAQGATGTEA